MVTYNKVYDLSELADPSFPILDHCKNVVFVKNLPFRLGVATEPHTGQTYLHDPTGRCHPTDSVEVTLQTLEQHGYVCPHCLGCRITASSAMFATMFDLWLTTRHTSMSGSLERETRLIVAERFWKVARPTAKFSPEHRWWNTLVPNYDYDYDELREDFRNGGIYGKYMMEAPSQDCKVLVALAALEPLSWATAAMASLFATDQIWWSPVEGADNPWLSVVALTGSAPPEELVTSARRPDDEVSALSWVELPNHAEPHLNSIVDVALMLTADAARQRNREDPSRHAEAALHLAMPR